MAKSSEPAHRAIGDLREELRGRQPPLSSGEAELAEQQLGLLISKLRPGLLSAALGMLAESPARLGMALLPERLVGPAERSLARALVSLSSMAARTAGLPEVAEQVRGALSGGLADDLAHRARVVEKVVKLDAPLGAVAGGVGGLAGVIALPVEIPLVLGLALRVSHRTATGLGVDTTSMPGAALPLHALDLAIGGDSEGAVLRGLSWVGVTVDLPGGTPLTMAPALEVEVVRAPAEPPVPAPATAAEHEVVEGVLEPATGPGGSGGATGPGGGALTRSGAVGGPLTGPAVDLEDLRAVASGTDPLGYLQLRMTLQRLAVRLAARRLAGAVPLVGAAVGGTLGYGLVDAVARSTRALAVLAQLRGSARARLTGP
jgi:hypothetical protein